MIKWFNLFLFLTVFISCSSSKNLIKEDVQPKPKQVIANDTVDVALNPISTLLLIDAQSATLLGESSTATLLLQKSIQVDSLNDAAHYELAKVYMNQDEPNLAKASDHLIKAIALDGSNRWYRSTYSRILLDQKKFEQAINEIRSLATDFPKQSDYLYFLAQAYEQAGKVDKAIAVFDELENSFGYSTEINYRKHKLYFDNGQIKQGIEEIEEIIENNPEYLNYSAYLASYYNEAGNLAKSASYAKDVLSQDSSNVEMRSILVENSVANAAYEELEHQLAAIVASQKLTLDEKVKVFVPFIDLVRQFPESKLYFIDAVARFANQNTNSAKVYALLGDFLYNSQMVDQAIVAYEKSINTGNAVYFVWDQLLLLKSEQPDYEDLMALSNRAQNEFPNEFLPNYLNGFSNFRLRNFNDAVYSLEKAVNTSNNNQKVIVEIYALLGDSYQQLDQFEQSNKNYDLALLKDPNNAYVLNNYSFYLAMRGTNLGKAEKMAKRAMKLNPTDANTLDTYGWVLFKKQEFEKALELFQLAVEKDSDSPAINEHLGDAYFMNGEKNQAITYWKKAQQLNSNSETLLKKIRTQQYHK